MAGEGGGRSGGIGFLEALLLLFIGLKLTGHVAWSWWWVMAPLWAPVSLFGVLVLAVESVAAIVKAFDRLAEREEGGR